MQLDVNVRPGPDEGELGTQSPRIAHARSGLHSKPFGIIAGGDDAGIFRFHRNDRDPAAAQLRPKMLLDRREIAVHVDQHPIQRATGRRGFCGFDMHVIGSKQAHLPADIRPAEMGAGERADIAIQAIFPREDVESLCDLLGDRPAAAAAHG